jgi:tetratricopeptide (TPR) repeat protein
VRRRKSAAACVCLWSILLAAGAPANEPLQLPAELQIALQYSPLEAAIFDDAERGTLHAGRLLEAAFVAGGVADESTLQEYLARYRTWLKRLRQLAPREEQAAVVFGFLHQKILTGEYDLRCSRMTEVFDTGNYNCVTATILFNVLAAEVGLKASGGESPAHVVSLVRTSRGVLEIETTSPQWFERARSGNLPRPTPSGKNAPRPPFERELHAPELTAIVYYNVGVDLAEQHDYAEAVAANYKALRLDPQCQNARGNLLAAVNNWALHLAECEEFAEAVELLEHGRRLAPDHKTFTLNYTAIYQRWVQSLRERGQHAKAAALRDRAASECLVEP